MTTSLEEKVTLRGRITGVNPVNNGALLLIKVYMNSLTTERMSEETAQQEGLKWIGQERDISVARDQTKIKGAVDIRAGRDITVVKPGGEIVYTQYKTTIKQDQGRLEIMYMGGRS